MKGVHEHNKFKKTANLRTIKILQDLQDKNAQICIMSCPDHLQRQTFLQSAATKKKFPHHFSTSCATHRPSQTFSDNKGQPYWLNFVPLFPLQVAAGLVNGSRHEDSAHHLTMIRM